MAAMAVGSDQPFTGRTAVPMTIVSAGTSFLRPGTSSWSGVRNDNYSCP